MLWGFLTGVAGVAFVTSGLIGWRRRPENSTGRLLVLGGLAWLLFGSLWNANAPILYTSGSAFGSLPIALLLLLVAVYPHGRPTTRLERVFVTVLFPVAILAGLLPTMFEGDVSSLCSGCRENSFLVADEKGVYDALQGIFAVVGIVFFLGVIVLAVRRWRVSTPAMRRVLRPVYLTGGVSVAAIGVGFALSFASGPAGNVLWILALVGVIALPFAFLGGLLRTSLMLGVRRLLDYADDPASEGAQEAVRQGLGDPTARLGLWLEQVGGYVDVNGNPLPLLADADGRAYSRIDADNMPLGFIEHDATLDTHEPELLAQIITACRIALEKDRGRQALQRSEGRMRALIDAVPDLMIRFRRDGTYLDIGGDPRALVRSPEEMIGRNVRDFLPDDLIEPLMDCAARALDTGEAQGIEYELELGGEVRYFEARMVPSSRDEIVSIVRDFTERRHLEAELALRLAEVQREQQFTRTVVNTAPIVLMLCDEQGGIIRFNDSTEKLTGYVDDDRIRGQIVWEVFAHPEDTDALRLAFEGMTSDGPPVEIQCRWLTRAGTELVVFHAITAIVDGQGRNRRLVTAVDVTEREENVRILQQQRDFLGTISRATPSLIAVVEADGRISEEGVNLAFEQATGHGEREARGRNFWELVISPDQWQAVGDEFNRSVETGEAVRFSSGLDQKTHERLLVDWSCTPLAELGERRKFLLCGSDVSDRERHVADVRASRARLLEAQADERRRLERNLHDGAQQRLVSLSLALRLAQAKLPTDPQSVQEILAGASDELALALGELRELARGIHPALLSERGLVAAVESLAERAPLPVELAAISEERLPAPVEAAVFYVISESLANIGKYAQASVARVSVVRDNGRAVVEVDDDGVGGADPVRGSGYVAWSTGSKLSTDISRSRARRAAGPASAPRYPAAVDRASIRPGYVPLHGRRGIDGPRATSRRRVRFRASHPPGADPHGRGGCWWRRSRDPR